MASAEWNGETRADLVDTPGPTASNSRSGEAIRLRPLRISVRSRIRKTYRSTSIRAAQGARYGISEPSWIRSVAARLVIAPQHDANRRFE